MFLQMKGLGFYKEYETYQDYKIGKGMEKTPEKQKEDFRDTLTSKEREEFDFMFGKESG